MIGKGNDKSGANIQSSGDECCNGERGRKDDICVSFLDMEKAYD